MKFLNYITYEKLDKHGKIKGDGDSTRARKVNAIKSFFLFLEQTGVIENNPMVKLSTPKVGKKEVVFMNVDESRQLLNSVKKFNGEYKDRDYAIVTILLNCALRRSEIVALNVDSIKGDKLYISGKGNKERTVDLTPACMNAIQKYLPYRPDVKDENGEPLFVSERNKRVCKETVALVVKKYVKKAGLNPKYTTHKIRHTSASLMYQNMEKKDIKALQEILGHESIITTQIYTHIDSESKRTAIYSNPLANEI
jgi:site-specific recombinase XerD